jgi:hypothetical protein
MLGVRVPRAVSEGIRRQAKTNNMSITDVVLNDLKPYDVYTSPEGQDALGRITKVLEHGTSTVQSRPTGVQQHEDDSWWESINLHKYIDGDTVVWEHRIVQREGETREQALSQYADVLWGEWYAKKPTPQREALLVDLETKGRHVFRIGYPNFQKWRVFPSPYELDLHWKWYVLGQKADRGINFMDAQPANPEEQRFYDWSLKYLTEVMDHYMYSYQAGNGVVVSTSPNTQDGGWSYVLKYYTRRDSSDNMRYWAGYFLTQYRQAQVDTEVDRFNVMVSALSQATLHIHTLEIQKDLKTS